MWCGVCECVHLLICTIYFERWACKFPFFPFGVRLHLLQVVNYFKERERENDYIFFYSFLRQWYITCLWFLLCVPYTILHSSQNVSDVFLLEKKKLWQDFTFPFHKCGFFLLNILFVLTHFFGLFCTCLKRKWRPCLKIWNENKNPHHRYIVKIT